MRKDTYEQFTEDDRLSYQAYQAGHTNDGLRSNWPHFSGMRDRAPLAAWFIDLGDETVAQVDIGDNDPIEAYEKALKMHQEIEGSDPPRFWAATEEEFRLEESERRAQVWLERLYKA